MSLYHPIAFLLAAALFRDGSDDGMDAPLIVVDAPTPGTQVRSGDTLLIDVLAYDEDLHEISLTITAASDSTVQFHSGFIHTHEDQARYREKFPVPAVTRKTDVVLHVRALDMEEHVRHKSVSLQILP